MDWSLSKLRRIESGLIAISVSDLRALLLHYDITDPKHIERLVEIAKASKDRRAWWTGYREATSQQYLTFLAYENAASRIYQFEPLIIPGLLQEEDYARVILQTVGGSATEKRVEEWVELRMRRQEELLDREDPPEMLFIIDEAALRRWVGGPEVMRRQLLRLKQIAGTYKNVTIQVVPFIKGAHPGLTGPFVILEFADEQDDDVLFVENSRGDMISRDEHEELAPTRQALDRLRDISRKDLESVIDEIVEDMP
jgi:hypothetical protein